MDRTYLLMLGLCVSSSAALSQPLTPEETMLACTGEWKNILTRINGTEHKMNLKITKVGGTPNTVSWDGNLFTRELVDHSTEAGRNNYRILMTEQEKTVLVMRQEPAGATYYVAIDDFGNYEGLLPAGTVKGACKRQEKLL